MSNKPTAELIALQRKRAAMYRKEGAGTIPSIKADFYALADFCEQTADRLAVQEAEIERLKKHNQEQIDYSIDLQRIIEALCHGHELPAPKTGAMHHYEMALELKKELDSIKDAAANGPKRFGMVAWADAHGTVHLDSQDNIKDACLVDADEAAAHAINMHKHGEQDAAERLAQYFASMGMNTLAADIRLQAAHWPLPAKPKALQPQTTEPTND